MEYKVERDGTLLPFLLERMEGRSRSSVKSYLTHGQVAVNGCHTTRHDTPLTAGDRVTVTKHRTAGTLHHPMLRIVYEDERLINGTDCFRSVPKKSTAKPPSTS